MANPLRLTRPAAAFPDRTSPYSFTTPLKTASALRALPSFSTSSVLGVAGFGMPVWAMARCTSPSGTT